MNRKTYEIDLMKMNLHRINTYFYANILTYKYLSPSFLSVNSAIRVEPFFTWGVSKS